MKVFIFSLVSHRNILKISDSLEFRDFFLSLNLRDIQSTLILGCPVSSSGEHRASLEMDHLKVTADFSFRTLLQSCLIWRSVTEWQ